MMQYSSALAQSHSLVSLVGGQRILFIHHWDEYRDRCLQLHCIFSSPNPSLPRSSFLCHLTERLVSFSLRVFARMWAARTLWHAWGLPMRLDGDSDTTARPNDLQNRRRGLEKGIFSAVRMSHWGPVCSPELLLCSCVCLFFLVKSVVWLF